MIAGMEMEYEKNQKFNFIVSWLHSFRYKKILSLIEEYDKRANDLPVRIVEIGCAHAKLYSLLDQRFKIDYTGIDIDADFVSTARSRYSHNPNFHMIHDSAGNASDVFKNADIIVALEAFEHIPGHEVVRIIEAVSAAQPDLFVCSVPIEIGPAVWLKNFGSLATGYIRHKEYCWTETFWAGLYQLDRLPSHHTGHKGFDWRWLAQTIRHNLKIIKLKKFPFSFLPAALAFSVFIVARPKSYAPAQHKTQP